MNLSMEASIHKTFLLQVPLMRPCKDSITCDADLTLLSAATLSAQACCYLRMNQLPHSKQLDCPCSAALCPRAAHAKEGGRQLE